MANVAKVTIDSVVATLLDVICSILAYRYSWALVNLLDCSVEGSYIIIDVFDETHCCCVACNNRKVQVGFIDTLSKGILPTAITDSLQ